MDRFELCAPCLFGIEGILGDELRRLGMENVRAETGRVFFSGGYDALAAANQALSTAERVMISVGSFEAATFEELFEGVRALPWDRYIPRGCAFPVKGSSLDSRLGSVPACQSIIKKAVAEKLGGGLVPETGPRHQIRFTLMRDKAALYIDTSGEGLHKRGYRAVGNAAPLRETLAAAMVKLARFRGKGAFLDPFCGSGTIPIEAAFAALNRAPGLFRRFDAMDWPEFPRKIWTESADRLRAGEYRGEYYIMGSDIDPRSISIAEGNALKAGVSEFINFEVKDAGEIRVPEGATVVTNPPYGERIMEKREAEEVYRSFGQAAAASDKAKYFVLSSHTEFERAFGRRADKKRKLYNGMIKCDLFMYFENR
ncbi:MAG: THUMP domain-containing class I SAM-dependent RNA methyltransferase [Oscillospiraceae bacterium]|jgi:putative N6-adenine-specific DNA methylase